MITLAFAVHNHQPVGNFDHVFEDAHRTCYRAFLDLLANYPAFRLSMHWSGPLLDWLEAHHPDTLDLLADLARRSQVEILGGACYEPILPGIPREDRLGQIEMMSQLLEARFGTRPTGMWLPERVWEQGLVRSIADAGIRYTAVDESHFLYAGFEKEELVDFFLAEDQGRTIAVFPIDEKLRYMIPFAEIPKLLDYLREWARSHDGSTIVYADDGEKFGVWPGTAKHCYEDRWLPRFIEAVLEQSDWLTVVPLGEVCAKARPRDAAYLPDSSYREMMEWTLPLPARRRYETARKLLLAQEDDAAARLLRGASWRSFFRKYPEARQMEGRMLDVSKSVHARKDPPDALRALYRAQCNCAYWHGVFGGLYLPHLRFAVYEQLIAADKAVRPALDRVDLRRADVDLDGVEEVILANKNLALVLAPARGGHLSELDLRPRNVNLIHTLARRPEFYHDAVRKAQAERPEAVATIHDEVRLKDAGLLDLLQYDPYRRESFIDHLLPEAAGPDALSGGEYPGVRDLVDGPFELTLAQSRRGLAEVRFARTVSLGESLGPGEARLAKTARLRADGDSLRFSWSVENRSARPLRFASEWTFTLLAGEAHDRYFRMGEGGQSLGNLSTNLALADVADFRLVDEYLRIEVVLRPDPPAAVWTFPIW
ncbi:MAG: alpha-amylase/4-alpha-glucanotransferase domain-containing protein, partial [Planctomycetota bacterium]